MRLSSLIGWGTLLVIVFAVVSSFGLPARLVYAATRTYSGTVKINGANAPDGTTVLIFVNGQTTPCASTTTAGGNYSVGINDTGGNCPVVASTNTTLYFDVAGPFGTRRVDTDVFEGTGTDTENLEYNWHQISGSVSVNGTPPPAGAAVQAFVGSNSTACITTDSGAGGSFSMVIVRGTTGVGGDQPAACQGSTSISFKINDSPVPGVTVAFSAGANSAGQLLAIAEGGHRVQGTATIGSSPAAGTQVQAFNGSTLCGSATTNASGQFDLNIPPAIQTAGCGTNGATISFKVAGQSVTETVQFQAGGSSTNVNLTVGSASGTVTPTVTATSSVTTTATATGTATSTATATATATGTAATPRWLDRPPGGAGATQSCPTVDQWLLLYWGGTDGTAIATAATTCASVDRFWVNRQGSWLGYAKAAPGASDTWNALTGEAHFARGGQ